LANKIYNIFVKRIELKDNTSHKSLMYTAIFMQRTMYLSV